MTVLRWLRSLLWPTFCTRCNRVAGRLHHYRCTHKYLVIQGEAAAPPGPRMYDLWVQSHGNQVLYRDLLHQHGYLLHPGDPGYEQGTRNLPCGWPGRPEISEEPQ